MAKKIKKPKKYLRRIDIPRNLPTVITLRSKELTSQCPLFDEPDFYTVEVQFKARKGDGIEIKSFRKYLWAFRRREIFGEALAAKIWKDIHEAVEPEWLLVTLEEHRGYTSQITRIGAIT